MLSKKKPQPHEVEKFSVWELNAAESFIMCSLGQPSVPSPTSFIRFPALVPRLGIQQDSFSQQVHHLPQTLFTNLDPRLTFPQGDKQPSCTPQQLQIQHPQLCSYSGILSSGNTGRYCGLIMAVSKGNSMKLAHRKQEKWMRSFHRGWHHRPHRFAPETPRLSHPLKPAACSLCTQK